MARILNCKELLRVLHCFPLIQLNPTHLSDHTHFSAIHLQFMLNFHRPGLTAMHQTTHTSSIYLAFHFNENPFPFRMGRYSQNFFQADLTLVVTDESHPPYASNIFPK